MKYFRKWLKMREALDAAIRAAITTNENKNYINDNGNINDFDNNANCVPNYHDDDACAGVDVGVDVDVDVDVDVSKTVYRIRSNYLGCAYVEDCLFGKGPSVSNHPGNVGMRRLVEQKYECWDYISKARKRQLAEDIVRKIQVGGGRFLKEDFQNNTMLFIEASDQDAVRKVMIAFFNLKKKRLLEAKKLSKGGLTAVSHHPSSSNNSNSNNNNMSNEAKIQPCFEEDSPRGKKRLKNESRGFSVDPITSTGSLFDVDSYSDTGIRTSSKSWKLLQSGKNCNPCGSDCFNCLD